MQMKTPASSSKRSSLPAIAWRYRVPVAGLLALILALVGEALQRTTPETPAANPQLGQPLVIAAVLLVGLVAWVRDDWPRLRFPSRLPVPAEPATDPPLASIPVRRAGQGHVQAALVARPVRARKPQGPAWRRFAYRYVAFRQRLGWIGTVAGLLAVLVIAAALYMVLSRDFSDPAAPWLWLAMLAALVLTFVGARPLGDNPLAHDPAEPRDEPPVSKAEWVVIALIIAVAVILRFWDLEHIPAGPYIDEADRALRARFINGSGPSPLEFMPFSFFSTDWWGVPTAYFWLVAQSLKVFGDNLTGARTVHVLAGIATVWYTYRIGRLAWSPRAGLIAAALLTVSDFAIQFSRTAGESTITLFTWAVCFYYLYKGLKTMRPLDFVLSGLAAGLTLYGYVSGKLLPIFIVALAVYLLVRWGFKGFRKLLPGLLLLGLTAFLMFAPNGYFVLKHPEAFTMRYKGTGIFNYPNQFLTQYNTNNWGVVIANQYAVTYRAFDVTSERGPFYPTHRPILPVPWAALWVLGTAYMVWRVGDARYAVLGAWLLSGIAGAALTNDTPTLQRVAGMVPTLALIPALYLDRLASALLPLPVRLPKVRWRARLARLATNAAIAALILLLAFQTLTYYFGPYTAEGHYLEFTLEGRYAEKLDPRADLLYQSGIPALLGSQAPTYFLSKDVPIRDFINASDELPITNNDGRNANLIFWPRDDPAIRALQSLYPGGVTIPLSDTRPETLYTVFRATTDTLNSQRQVSARYTSSSGQVVEGNETRLGTLQPPDSPGTPPLPALNYPVQAEWQTGVVAPAYAVYHLSLKAPAGGALLVDGTQVLTSTATTTEAEIVLAKGVHQVDLRGKLTNPNTPVELRWGTADGPPLPVARKYFWSGSDGAFVGQVYSQPGTPALLTTPSLSAADLGFMGPPARVRRDVALVWKDLNGSIGIGGGLFGVWQGTLHIQVAGGYLFDVDTDGMASVWVDHNLVGTTRVPASTTNLPAVVNLTPGDHSFEARFRATGDHSRFGVLWQGPGIEHGAVTAVALAPINGGVWLRAAQPTAPVPGADLLSVDYPPARVSISTVVSAQNWREAKGLASLPGGAFAVADRAERTISVYDRFGAMTRSWVVENRAGDRGPVPNLTDLAVTPDGRIAALDYARGMIRFYTLDGREEGSFSPASLALMTPSGMVVAPDGSIYLADSGHASVVHLTSKGARLGSYTGAGGSFLPIVGPMDVAVSPGGSVYVSDTRGRVVRLDKTGKIDAEYTVPVGGQQSGGHLAFWGDLLAVSSPEGHSVAFIDVKSGQVTNLKLTISGVTGLPLPTGMAAGSDGRLYVLDAVNHRIIALDHEK